jgi:lysyl endopeptidase
MCKKLLLLALLASLAPGEAQVMTAGGYAPQGFSKLAVQSPRSVVQLPPLNNFALLQAAKSEELVRPGPFKFGEAVPVALNMRAGHGEWTVDHINQRRIWRAMVKSPGAVSLSILFSRFYLPPDSEFYVLSRTGQRLGAFTAAVNNKEDGKFATAPLAGDLLLLEYNEPLGYQGNALVRRAEIRIHKVVHGFRKTILDADSSGRCNIDVMCSEGDGKVSTITTISLESCNARVVVDLPPHLPGRYRGTKSMRSA